MFRRLTPMLAFLAIAALTVGCGDDKKDKSDKDKGAPGAGTPENGKDTKKKQDEPKVDTAALKAALKNIEPDDSDADLQKLIKAGDAAVPLVAERLSKICADFKTASATDKIYRMSESGRLIVILQATEKGRAELTKILDSPEVVSDHFISKCE